MNGIQLFIALVKKDIENEYLSMEQARIFFRNILRRIKQKKLENKIQPDKIEEKEG